MQVQKRRFETLSYWFASSLFVCHEMDAVGRAEWKLLYVLRDLEDSNAYIWFVLLHIPIYVALLWGSNAGGLLEKTVRIGLSSFLVIHAGLHFRLRNDPLYFFTPPVETITVYGAAVASMIFLMFQFVWREHDRQHP